MIFFEKRCFCILCKKYKSVSNMSTNHGKIGFCKCCYDGIPKLSDNCFEGPGNIKAVFSAFLNEGTIKEAVKEYKFSDLRLYGEFFGKIVAEKVLSFDVLKNCDYIIPVPLHHNRLKDRGYNQSEILAKAISERLEIPMVCDALFRVRETEKQSTLKGLERMKNVKNAFFAHSETVRGKNIILVDDICTMGETLKACERALTNAGAGDVFAVTLCISPDMNKYL